MPILFENYITGDNTGISIFADNWITQSFTSSETHDLTSVKLLLYRIGSPGTITVSIRATTDSGDFPFAKIPTGSDIDGTTGTTNGNTLTTNSAGGWREITLGSVVRINKGTTYAIVVRALTGSSPNHRLIWRWDDSEATYTIGNLATGSNNGATWGAPRLESDLMFEEYGNTVYVSFPSQAITRVTNIIHRYVRAAGVYTLELALGEVTSDFGLPQWLTAPQPATAKKAVKDEKKIIAESTPIQKAIKKSIDETFLANPPPSVEIFQPIELTPRAKDILATPAGQAIQARQEALRLRAAGADINVLSERGAEIVVKRQEEFNLQTELQDVMGKADAPGITGHARTVLIKRAIAIKRQLRSIRGQ